MAGNAGWSHRGDQRPRAVDRHHGAYLLQLATLANGIDTTHVAHFFVSVGDNLATPQLTEASPFIYTNSLQSVSGGGLTDEVMERIASQLLPLFRMDSVGSVLSSNRQFVVQFTGDDNYEYAVQVSTTLVDWAIVSTNVTVSGVFNFSVPSVGNACKHFYRTLLLN
jgi:hypothetical protein